jgi:signal peptidase I
MSAKWFVTDIADLLGEPANDWSRELALTPRKGRIDGPSMRAVLKRTWSIVSLLLVIAGCVFWALFLRPQSLGGPAGYVLVSGHSMNPLYHTGDMILVERQKSYTKGDIIAYRVPKGDAMAGAQVIHRIVGGDATHGFVVQGDNRTAPDVWRPKPGDIVGSAALQIPQAVVGLQYLRSPLLLGLLAASFVFVFLLNGTKDEQKTDEGDSENDGVDDSTAPAPRRY